MENVFTLMVFPQSQQQAISLQYKSLEPARKNRDILNGGGLNKITVPDDYGRELSIRPCEVQIALLQDIDRASEGNAILAVKNNITQALAQMRTQGEIDADPKVKAAVTRMQLAQGANQSGAFRQ